MKVYAKIDAENHVTAVNSAAFIGDLSGWTEIDEGDGDRYNLAQSNYFPHPLIGENGEYRYRFVDGKIEEVDVDD